MKIIHISAECYPIAKVGGLADVVGALPKYLNGLDVDATVIMPFYDIAFTQNIDVEAVYEDALFLGSDHYSFKILKATTLHLGYDLYLVDVPALIFKDYIYSYDDTARFLAFQLAALQWVQTHTIKPDVVHCHDHHTGLIPFMMQYCTMFQNISHIPTVLTIHNAQYQGWFSHDRIDLLPAFDRKHIGLLDWNNSINPLAAAIKCAWKVNTVSPSYMEELIAHANGLEWLLAHEQQKCTGILNGIDTAVWDTTTDPYLIKNYSIATSVSGKKANKKWLCKTYNLDENKPLFIFIGRLVHEKGTDLFPEAFKKALENDEVSILLLGSGDKETEHSLLHLKEEIPANYNVHIGYDEALSHKMYAGADFLLMPSRVEPCGLNQLYSMRYGTVPIVNAIGGLKDTVIDVANGGYGFMIHEVSVTAIYDAIVRATAFYKDTKQMTKTKKRIMQLDYSWSHAASQYVDLYKALKR